MTGYGRACKTLHGREITVELRSVNNRFLDLRNQLALAYEGNPEILEKELNTTPPSAARWTCSSA